jgi:hypothetical protein
MTAPRVPPAQRPLRRLILALAEVVQNERYLTMTEGQVVSKVEFHTGGTTPTEGVRAWVRLLRKEGFQGGKE